MQCGCRHGNRFGRCRRWGWGTAPAQGIECHHHAIGTHQQRLDRRSLDGVLRGQRFDGGFEPMRQLAQPHRASQTGAALEGVQRAHAGRGRARVAGMVVPFAQPVLQLRQQLLGFFLKDREQLGVDGIDGIDVVVVGHDLDGRAGQGAAVGRLRRFGRQLGFRQRVRAFQGQPFVRSQLLHQTGVDRAQEAGRKLMQQTADLVGRVDEELRLTRTAVASQARAVQRMFERPRQCREVGVAHRGRIASERMGQRHGVVRHRRALVFNRPFGQFSDEPARQFVGFVEVDVEQRDADAQRPDDFDLLIGVGVGIRIRIRIRIRSRRWLGLALEQQIGRCGFSSHRRRDAEVEVEVHRAQVDLERLGRGDRRGCRRGRRLRHVEQQVARLGRRGCRRERLAEVAEVELEASLFGRHGRGGRSRQRQVEVGRTGQLGDALHERLQRSGGGLDLVLEVGQGQLEGGLIPERQRWGRRGCGQALQRRNQEAVFERQPCDRFGLDRCGRRSRRQDHRGLARFLRRSG